MAAGQSRSPAVAGGVVRDEARPDHRGAGPLDDRHRDESEGDPPAAEATHSAVYGLKSSGPMKVEISEVSVCGSASRRARSSADHARTLGAS